jgi:hypothetical protein
VRLTKGQATADIVKAFKRAKYARQKPTEYADRFNEQNQALIDNHSRSTQQSSA